MQYNILDPNATTASNQLKTYRSHTFYVGPNNLKVVVMKYTCTVTLPSFRNIIFAKILSKTWKKHNFTSLTLKSRLRSPISQLTQTFSIVEKGATLMTPASIFVDMSQIKAILPYHGQNFEFDCPAILSLLVQSEQTSHILYKMCLTPSNVTAQSGLDPLQDIWGKCKNAEKRSYPFLQCRLPQDMSVWKFEWIPCRSGRVKFRTKIWETDMPG